MKYWLFFLPLLPLTAGKLSAQEETEEGLQFVTGNWKEILQQAAAENKPVFLDAYTAWCRPCRQMMQDVFPDKAVGDFFNANFINVSLNMEKGEGIELARRYNIQAFPTLLFLSPQGQTLHRAAGFHNADELLALGRTALDPRTRLSGADERFAKGERDPAFLYNYTQLRYQLADDSHGPAAEAYLNTQPNWGEERNIRFLFRYVNDADSKLFDYLARNRPRFEQFFGAAAVMEKIQELIYKKVDAGKGKDLSVIDALYRRVYPDKAALLAARFRMFYFQQQNNMPQYAEAANYYFNKFDVRSADELNDAAMAFYESVNDRELLKKAVKWAEKAVSMQKLYHNLETLASLHYKLGNKKKALKAAREAIEKAKQTGENYSDMDALLTKIYQL